MAPESSVSGWGLRGSGDDVLIGSNGNDHLSGGSGNDIVSGGNGEDHMRGGSGDYYMLGGACDDRDLGHARSELAGQPHGDIEKDAGRSGYLEKSAKQQEQRHRGGEYLHRGAKHAAAAVGQIKELNQRGNRIGLGDQDAGR